MADTSASHNSVKQAMAFCQEGPEPTEAECQIFIRWHSRGKDYGEVTPGLLRLLAGFKYMGLACGRDGWSQDFKSGLLFLTDFDLADTVITPMAVRVYQNTFGYIPTVYAKYRRFIGDV